MNKINRFSNCFIENINIIKSTELYYINKQHKVIPWYSIFNYYLLIKDDKLYINDWEFTHIFDYFDQPIRLHSLIEKNIFNYKNFSTLYIDKCILIKNNYANVGHSFFNILNTIYEYFKLPNKNEYKIVICDDLFNYNNFLISVIYLFFKKEDITVLNDYTLLKTNELLLIKDFSNKKDNGSIDFLIDFLQKTIKSINTPIYENICLIKTIDTQNINPCKMFDKSYKDFFEEHNFKIIKPEEYKIEELYYIINNCKKIILSWGCCSYLNSIFINPTTHTLILCHKDYKNEYNSILESKSINYFLNSGWFPKGDICNKKYILDLNEEINEDIKQQIKNIFNII